MENLKAEFLELERRGYLSLKVSSLIDINLINQVTAQLTEIFNDPSKLYFYNSYKGFRHSFHINNSHPHNSELAQLYQQCSSFCEWLLGEYFSYKGWDKDLIHKVYSNHQSFLRPTMYHPQAIGTGMSDEHVDTSLITLLVGGSAEGLEVFDQQEKKFVSVPTLTDTVVVTFGAIMQEWSNGKRAASLHRVISKKEALRVSFPFFFHPSPEAPMNERFATFQSFYNFKAKEAIWLNDELG